MELTESDYYKIESHEDKLDILELIYKHKPELLFNTSLYDYRYQRNLSRIYMYIGTSFNGNKLDCYTLPNLSQIDINLLTKQQFLKLVLGDNYDPITPLKKRINFKFT